MDFNDLSNVGFILKFLKSHFVYYIVLRKKLYLEIFRIDIFIGDTYSRYYTFLVDFCSQILSFSIKMRRRVKSTDVKKKMRN